MIIVEGWVRLAPGEIDRMRPLAAEMMRQTRAEPGCLDYAFAADLAEPDLLRVIERWVDQAALDLHFTSAHMAQFNQALAGAQLLGASVKAYAAEEARVIIG